MTDDWRERIWDLFDRAVELADDERNALLNRECQSDSTLRQEVESLLRHANQAETQDSGFLKSPLIRSTSTESSELSRNLPERIGRYRVLGLLGSGAMGSVYEAEQDQPRRSVAVKVMHRGYISPEMQRRFLKESQILGQLRHRGIAQIYDAGVDENGLPFFAMELIQGEPIDEYTIRSKLSVPERMQLMASVCDAVQHAHEQGVIHRDLKPSNVLVDQSGQCKVLDFGIARTSNADLYSSTTQTETGQLLGTLAYMSPEQVSAEASAINSSTDVYALGLILYELLSGARPYQLNHLPLPEAAQTILEVEPPRLGKWNRQLRGDIETIVAKSLEKERSRRYPTPGALRDDIQRHLAHQTILARPPSTIYRIRKFSRRNRSTVAIISALLLGLLGTSWFAFVAWTNSSSAILEKNVALLEAYVARLSVANSALEDHDVNAAKTQLDATPLSLRGWEWRHLNSRLDISERQQTLSDKHQAQAVSSSNGLYVQHSDDRSTSIRDFNDKEFLRIDYPWPVTFVSVVSMRGDEARAYVGDENRHRVVTQTGRVLLDLEQPKPFRGRVAAISPDLRFFGISWIDQNNVVELHELETGQLLHRIQGHTRRIYGVSFSHDGEMLATSGEDGTVRLWSTSTGQQLHVCRGHTGNIWSVSFRQDGSRVVSASADGTVRQWSTTTGEEIGYGFDRHQGDVTSAIYSPDGARIVSIAHDRTIRVWNAENQREQIVHYGANSTTSLAFAPDGERLATGDGSSTARFWNVSEKDANPLILRGHDASVYPAVVSPDGLWIASGGWDSKAIVWNAKTGRAVSTMNDTNSPVRSLVFTPDSTSIMAIYDQVPYFRRWDFRTHETQPERVNDELREVPATVALSPDGKYLAAAGLAGAQVWDLSSGSLIAHLSKWDCYGHKLAFSPDGEWLVGPGESFGATSLWSTKTYQLHKTLSADEPSKTGLVFGVAFSPDSRWVASGGKDLKLRVWDVASGKLLQCLSGHTDEIFAIAFHPTEPRMVSAGRDRIVRVWDLESGKELARLSGHKSYVWSLEFTPDGRTLVSGSGDSTVRLWSTRPTSDFYSGFED